MTLNIKALTLTGGIVWCAAVLLAGILNLISGHYAVGFLKVMASLYPGYQASGSFGDILVGALYAFIDGAVAGLVVAWLYNRLSRSQD